MTSEEHWEALLNRLHGRWRLVTLVPIVYLLLGLAISQYYFIPQRQGKGFLDLSPGGVQFLFGIGIGLVFVMVVLFRRVRMRHREELIMLGDFPEVLESRTLEQQLFQFALCDGVAFPGIIIFLLTGSEAALVVFVFISLLFYLAILPRERDFPRPRRPHKS
ncbi:MAG: hypothetical protein JJU11_11050 [Candidatus Sumerlaeia bacterium]|nr:hypothetical protein [Candidatus Sumerlaeia bacterium]